MRAQYGGQENVSTRLIGLGRNRGSPWLSMNCRTAGDCTLQVGVLATVVARVSTWLLLVTLGVARICHYCPRCRV